MEQLPPTFAATREALRAVACYAIAPARRARTGRIGLRSTGDGFGTPPFDDGRRFVVRGDRLARDRGDEIAITTVRAACGFLGVEPSPDPGVGHDLPPFDPDGALAVDSTASFALGTWYAFGQAVLDRLRAGAGIDVGRISEAQLWPEHFDLAVTVEPYLGGPVNVGFSPGDRFDGRPYVYVGPHDAARLDSPFWNAPFGAFLPYGDLVATPDPVARALRFVGEGLRAAEHAPTSR